MESVQNGVLVLYSSLLVADTTNRYGSANSNYTELTFTNINMKQLLGTNFDKYQKFNLILNSIVVPTTTTAVAQTNDANVMIYMAGLPFDSGSTYSTVTGFNSNMAFIGAIHINSTALISSINTYPPTFFNTIIKPQDKNDITICLKGAIATLTTNGATFELPSATIYPQMAFTFSIVPVLGTLIVPYPSQEDQNITYKQRLFK